MATDPFLAGLPAPAVIDELSFEEILADMKSDLLARFPDIAPVLSLESSTVAKVMQVCAFREKVLRAAKNDAARANLLAFAAGADLDHVGANASPLVARMFGEDDERFRTRILLATQARNIGSEARFKLVALNADLIIRDAKSYRIGRDPTVYVAILTSEPTGAASPALVAQVQAAFDQLSERSVNSPVVVVSAVTSVVNVTAQLVLTPGTPPTIVNTIAAALKSAWQAEGGLGRDITREWLRSRLHAAGVYSVNLTSPAADVIKPPTEAASIGTVTLTVTGENS